MTDIMSKEERSRNMSRIRGKDTGPEKQVRSLLHGMGYRTFRGVFGKFEVLDWD